MGEAERTGTNRSGGALMLPVVLARVGRPRPLRLSVIVVGHDGRSCLLCPDR